MTPRFIALRALAVPVLLGATVVHAQSLDTATPSDEGPRRPKWEAGLAGISLRTPTYPASDENRGLLMPVPYFVYYGQVLRTGDSEGTRLRKRMAPNVELALSGGGTLSSDSSNSDARRGMPDLDYLIQVGPSLRLSYAGPQPLTKIIVNLPLRAAASVGSGLDWRGVVIAPGLTYRAGGFLDNRLSGRISFSSEFASTAMQRYYYDVAPEYETPERAAYRAKAGYLGSDLTVGVNYRFTPRVHVFASITYSNHSGAANDDSPLFRTEHGLTAATGFSWSFLQSKQSAED